MAPVSSHARSRRRIHLKNRAGKVDAVQPPAAEQIQRQNIGAEEHRRFIRQHAATDYGQRVLLCRVKVQPFHQLRRCGLPRDHQVIAVGHTARRTDHAVEFQLLVHAVLDLEHIAVDQRADAAHALQIAVALQLAQGIAHHGAANAQHLGQLQLTGQLRRPCIQAGAQLLQKALCGLLAAQLAAKAVFRRFIHCKNPFVPGRHRPDSICRSRALCGLCRRPDRGPPAGGRSRCLPPVE